MPHRDLLRELTVFGLLLAIGVLGRWAQPEWNFTPLAAVTAVGAFYFTSLLAAVCLPIGVLAVSDLLLPAHDSVPVLISIHLMMIVPLVLGRLGRHAEGNWQRAGLWAACGILPATTFFLVTNFAVWAFTGMYEKSVTGLLACYVAAVPFYRTMLAGDLFYLVVLSACLLVAYIREPALVRERA